MLVFRSHYHPVMAFQKMRGIKGVIDPQNDGMEVARLCDGRLSLTKFVDVAIYCPFIRRVIGTL